jgi:ABC-type polysaccharide/polyol phosphate transport system ATPase subunit
MSDIALRAEHLGKHYRLRGVQMPGGLLSDRIAESVGTPFRRATMWLRSGDRMPRARRPPRDESFWALRDVSFEIREGQAVGVIGRNGAGKSTLLKILSRITKPSEGRVDMYGRVGSLLEVGTGFHPELSGRENILLNGAILGMRRAEIARKFEEIVEFAEVGAFIDTPVKRYSSGMIVRLAFAVAAHLEPEILLVDEVLAVGDIAFQKKCLGKMDDVTRQGRTVIFVSHDLTAIQALCQRALRLAQGRVQGEGEVSAQIRKYVAESKAFSPSELDRPIPLSHGMQVVQFGFDPSPAETGRPASFCIEIDASAPVRIDELMVLVHDGLNRRVAVIDFRQSGAPYRANGRDRLRLTARLQSLPLVEGEYRIGLSIRSEDIISLDVLGRTDGGVPASHAGGRGIVAFEYAVEAAS